MHTKYVATHCCAVYFLNSVFRCIYFHTIEPLGGIHRIVYLYGVHHDYFVIVTLQCFTKPWKILKNINECTVTINIQQIMLIITCARFSDYTVNSTLYWGIIRCNCPSEFIIENIATYYMCVYNKYQDILLNAAIFHTKKDIYILNTK